jgi:hypothetical protein
VIDTNEIKMLLDEIEDRVRQDGEHSAQLLNVVERDHAIEDLEKIRRIFRRAMDRRPQMALTF